MSEEKKNLIRDVTKRLDKLPEDKKNYLLGYMNGIMDNEKIHSSKKETVSSD
jgi:hypothetical protein|uniref:Uncharacterized protein n=1 Tax=Siphoviridae sp. ctkyp1 TaxID=2825646 RepID=A0A8S5P4S5_9CAUD|nr:MAG TPA: hypothetical protein [Siphoviridae sp. ctkyp1]DAH50204.1 MAG TPA: hypothetical protein [Caudoviricetes sp.]DAN72738.1 MAG TPA: hypothetical protein [Caudoviricetes sp.]